MRRSIRQIVRMNYMFCCGYCGISETSTGAELTVDHFQPSIRGGTDDIENLVYCCHACNEHKSDFWTTDPIHRLLHPLRDDVSLHYQEDAEGRLVGLTETGIFHIERLHLNRFPLVEHRLWIQRVQDRLALAALQDQRLEEAEARIARMERFFGMPPTIPQDE
jgi:HNH endonuclease